MTNSDSAFRIESVVDLARAVQKSTSTRLLFRGQHTDKPLLPQIARIAKHLPYDEVIKLEQRMLEQFKRQSVPLLRSPRPHTNWDWLSIAQHQGLLTRLLDWTTNALAGLWFAVATDPPDEAAHGVLWELEVSPANEKSPSKKEDIFRLHRTYVFQPFHIDQRIVAQSAWFSVHKYDEERHKFTALDQNKKFKDSLRRYVIPREAFPQLRLQLRRMGVTQATIFPDLSGLCAEIQAECLGELRPLQTI